VFKKGHKFTGQALENFRKSRSSPEYRQLISITKRGIKNPHAKLSDEAAAEIMLKYISAMKKGDPITPTQRKIATEYNVSRSAILDVVHSRTWKHVFAETDRCQLKGCRDEAVIDEFCSQHYGRLRFKKVEGIDVYKSYGECIVTDCSNERCSSQFFCGKHYARQKTTGNPLLTKYDLRKMKR
jgi:hypothetical protein